MYKIIRASEIMWLCISIITLGLGLFEVLISGTPFRDASFLFVSSVVGFVMFYIRRRIRRRMEKPQ